LQIWGVLLSKVLANIYPAPPKFTNGTPEKGTISKGKDGPKKRQSFSDSGVAGNRGMPVAHGSLPRTQGPKMGRFYRISNPYLDVLLEVRING